MIFELKQVTKYITDNLQMVHCLYYRKFANGALSLLPVDVVFEKKKTTALDC